MYKDGLYQLVRLTFLYSLARLDCIKSNWPGVDKLPGKFIRECDSAIKIPFIRLHIVNLSIKCSEVPTDFKSAKIVQQLKKGRTRVDTGNAEQWNGLIHTSKD